MHRTQIDPVRTPRPMARQKCGSFSSERPHLLSRVAGAAPRLRRCSPLAFKVRHRMRGMATCGLLAAFYGTGQCVWAPCLVAVARRDALHVMIR